MNIKYNASTTLEIEDEQAFLTEKNMDNFSAVVVKLHLCPSLLELYRASATYVIDIYGMDGDI